MAQWNGSESGILRKNTPADNHDELLVFGYACKLFRDDEKALYIDQGKHLIPWMGDEKLKIDRYDCRGALSDIRKYEASREGFDAMRWLGLSDKERQLEELCDKERYYSLEMNEEEEEMYKEEEQKRQKTNTIQYSYDVPIDPESKKQDVQAVLGAEEEEEYVPPPILDVPVDIDIPKTVKENARIEKTALFVCKQGPQMEILIKAKQADNPQFSFLNQGDRLYKFYRHVLSALKNGRYQGYEPKVEKMTEDAQDDAQDHDSSSHYLHPSLLSANLQPEPPTAIPIPQIPYKPSANCTYSQLVNRIQGTQNESIMEPTKPTGVAQSFAQLTYEQQQYFQYYYAQQYYEYYKQMALFQQGQGGNPGQFVPPADFQNLDPNMQNYIQQLAYNQYMQQQPPNNNSYAQIVSNVNKDSNPYAAGMPHLPQKPQKEDSDISKNPVMYGVSNEGNTPKEPVEKPDVILKKPLLSLAAYGSGSDSESEDATKKEEEEVMDKKVVYMVPTGDTQIVIDKMAAYVSKNGEQFEDIVRTKSDQRFDFLNSDHKYNEYYRAKIRELKGEEKEKQEEKVVESKETVVVKPVKREKKVIAPVSFSIKKAKEEQPKEIKSALPIEESDEEDPENVATATNTIISAPAAPLVTATVCIAVDSSKSPREVVDINAKSSDKDDTREVVKENKKNGILDGDDPILEMIELTTADVSEDKKDAKRAEDKIKDKLAAAAREKLASVSRDRALQLERKKKAAAFLKLKSAESSTQGSDAAPEKDSCKSSSRRSSVEIIEVPKVKEAQVRKSKEKERSRSRDREKRKLERERSETKEKRKEEKEKVKVRERTRSREKEKRSKTPKRENVEEEAESKRRKDDDKKEKKKKSHKRKHSKSRHESRSKKKSKKRHRRSESVSSESSNKS